MNRNNVELSRAAGRTRNLITFAVSLFVLVSLSSCNQESKENTDSIGNEYAVKMAETILQDFPVLGVMDARNLKWSYTHGLVSSAMLDLFDHTGDSAYLEYVVAFADTMINEEGAILTYKMSDFNIDKINSGKMLLRLYKLNGEEKYRMAADTLRKQLVDHPKTEIGGFWHKKRYPHQMWLDGLYMGGPFLAEYAVNAGDKEGLDYAVKWYVNMENVARDDKTGLLYHGWDESSEQLWSDSITGLSKHFWGRGMGWYGMALVDVLDFIPEDHSGREQIIGIVNRMAEAIVKVQDEETGVWYQVLDQGTREGNYLESSVSSMFSYFLLKAVNKGYLDKEQYEDTAVKAYEGTVNTLVKDDGDGTITMSPCCAVAGLGGNPHRDGTYEYYINEKQRDNDTKAVGPFIMAGIQYDILIK